MDQRLYDKIKDNDPGGTAVQAAEVLAERTSRVLKPAEDRMISERNIYGTLGIKKGHAFMQALLLSSAVPDTVKGWLRPSEGGVDVTHASVVEIINMIADGGAIGWADAERLIMLGYDTVAEYPGVTAQMVQNARDQAAKGV